MKSKLVVTGRHLTFSKDVLAKSPELQKLYGNHSIVQSPVQTPVGKSNPLQALGPGEKVQRRSKTCVVVHVTITSYRKREIDDDNLIAAGKNLRDLIARELSVDDNDKRIRWEYGQVITRGLEETHVRITYRK